MRHKAKENLELFKKEIDVILRNFFSEKLSSYTDVDEFSQDFLEHLSEFTLRGGKRLRPALMYYTFRIFSDKDSSEIKKLSIYLELIQSFLLIHDDIMDKSVLRRGGKTIHKIFEEYSSKKGYGDNMHFGNTMAILNGDFACLLAYEIINNSKLDPDIKSKLTSLVSQEISQVIIGQIQDVLLTYESEFLQEDILKVHKNKTAVYTFKLPILSGALAANAQKEEMEV